MDRNIPDQSVKEKHMYTVNANYQELQGSYLFSTIAKKVAAYKEAHPGCNVISLGIGDVTQPLPDAVIKALHSAVDEMADVATFHGYAPDLGYSFLREAIAENDYRARGCDIAADEIFVSDGAKSDSANIQELFGAEDVIAVCDPVYPVYLDSNVMAGRAGKFDPATGRYTRVVYMPCTKENDFIATPPETVPDIIYLCFPNNPTGAAISRERLQEWVDYARRNGCVIIYDAAYEAYISEEDVPHSIYECEGAKECAIELRSFSKNAGFTGLRLAFTVVPKDLQKDGISLNAMWARRHGTKYNGAPYIVQKAGEACYTPEGKAQIRELVGFYMENARIIRDGVIALGYEAFGGVNSPYVWLKTPEGVSSWDFFDRLLDRCNIVGTPGCGFGPSGEGYFRLTAFGTRNNTVEAVERMKKL